ncbi:OLC1v1029621C1 [Oldenlandia corymbosa var. corymbosa]|uniref:OLC1v1029621C1 n=1 Tax=Oldenlandia corymbosa var. corymbosa TaxID=529605 RepID=A0AAV1CFR5_OLDCO|nr:OLC1v1029621C1 [Oldenlandia corymbosa var. corymbosa]
MELIRDWSGLIQEMLVEITKRIELVEDFMAFRGGVPLLMLAEKENCDELEVYSLSKRKNAKRLPLSETKGRRCTEAGFGWFLTVSSSGEINLFNPSSGSQIQLLDCTTFRNFEDYDYMLPEFTFIFRVALSANPSHNSKLVVTVIYGGGTALGFWRLGDLIWTGREPNFTNSNCWRDVHYYSGKFFAINAWGELCGSDHGSSSSILTRKVCGSDKCSSDVGCLCDESSLSHVTIGIANIHLTIDWNMVVEGYAYLLESSSGELLVVTRDGVSVDDD